MSPRRRRSLRPFRNLAAWAITGLAVTLLVSLFAGRGTRAPEVIPDGALRVVVDRVVDGDTLRVRTEAGEDLTVRLIGVDTPETVHPREPVQCYGPEASAFAERTVPEGSEVYLELDPSQGETDRYGRTLAYVWYVDTPDGAQLLNYELVAGGYGREYTYDTDYRHQRQLRAAHDTARTDRIGLWGAC